MAARDAEARGAPIRDTGSDAELLRWRNYIDARIAAAVAAELADIRMHAEAQQKAVAIFVADVRRQLREEIVAAVGDLRADITIEKAHTSGALVEIPKFLSRRDAG